ncbi:MAG: hypothetical protein AAFZ17_16485 [Cyanobacteria bacterium J06650_10]
MSITLLYHSTDLTAASIVRCGLLRSFSAAQVNDCKFDHFENTTNSPSQIYVLINPTELDRRVFSTLARQGRKIIVFGTLEAQFASEIGLEVTPLDAQAAQWGKVISSPDQQFQASQASIVYQTDHALTKTVSLRNRPLSRYDFTDEWNTFGFGKITTDGSCWSLCQQVSSQQVSATQAQAIAHITDTSGQPVNLYAAIADSTDSATLWFNRSVGPIDSLEWNIVETFCSQYRADTLACIPYLSEIPVGYSGTATMRLDCDQAIATARPLFEQYQALGMPLSLAIVTGLPPQPQDLAFIKDVLAHGGAIVSHSCTHPPNWGENETEAFKEAQQSKAWLEEHIPEIKPVHYAVSPFHQNPPYAVSALAKAGYLGFVGGIIHNDPEYLMARSGQVPFCQQPMISHSQQCMLHGDCFHQYGNSMTPYCNSFQQHLKAGYLFGYLDHPFSSTYQYGWETETERISAHTELLTYIHSHENIWTPNLVQALDFVRKRSLAQIDIDQTQSLRVQWAPTSAPLQETPQVQASWRGKMIPLLLSTSFSLH